MEVKTAQLTTLIASMLINSVLPISTGTAKQKESGPSQSVKSYYTMSTVEEK